MMIKILALVPAWLMLLAIDVMAKPSSLLVDP